MSLWGQTGKITAELPDGKIKDYFLKVSHSLTHTRPKDYVLIKLIRRLIWETQVGQ